MPQTSAGSGAAWTRSTADPPGGTSGEQSCLTIRLPDIRPAASLPRDSSHAHRADLLAGGATTDARQVQPRPSPSRHAAWAAATWQRTTEALRTKVLPSVRKLKLPKVSVAGSWERTNNALRGKVFPFVRQPKFWLACVTAVAVQVVLAAVMTPEEDQPPEQIRTAANPWHKRPAVASERIVVPPAQGSHDAVEPAHGGKHGTTTPLGVPASSDPSEATWVPEQTSTEADGVEDPVQASRMAESRHLTAEGRQFGGPPAGETDGATLGRIVPLEPMSDSSSHEQQR